MRRTHACTVLHGRRIILPLFDLLPRGLKNVELVGHQDPYCILSVGTQKFRSKTRTDAGKNPVRELRPSCQL